MPTVLKIGAFRFFFFSNELGEPPHIHVQDGKKLAKFWLGNVALASSTNFKAHELNELEKLVQKHEKQFMEAWNEYFSGK